MIRAKIERKRVLPMERFGKMPAKVDIAVGLVGPKAAVKHSGSDLTNAELGTVHELGSGIVPARHWLSVSFRRQKELIRNAYSLAWKKQLKKTTPNLNAIAASTGALAARNIRLYMLKGPHFKPKLAPETVALKQSTSTDPNRPIFDTGALAAAISWKKI